jgi:DNA-binding transcriptional LysR family regulator
MDTLASIRTFRQVVEFGSFVAAAQSLDVSTAMVTKHVQHLEQRLRVRLLNRNPRKLSLTEPGRVYFERCKSILEQLQATELELSALGSVARGTLRVSAPSSASGQWLADLLAEYRRRYPQVVVDLSFEDRFVNLVDEGYDLALRIASSRDALPVGLIARSLRPAMFCLAASREYLKRRGAPRTLEDLAHHDFVAVGNLVNALPPKVTTPEKSELLPPRVVLRYRSMEGVANAVATGIGIAPVPAVLLEDPAFREVLTPVLADYPLQQATLYVVYASRKFVPAKLRTFVDFIVESLTQTSQRTPRPVFGTRDPRSGLRPPGRAHE